MKSEVTRQLLIEYLPFLVIIIFQLIVGIVLILKRQWIYEVYLCKISSIRSPKPIALLGAGITIFMLIALSALLFLGASPWEKAAIMNQVMSLSADNIDSVDIIPWRLNKSWDVKQPPRIVRDPAKLKQLCECLQAMESWSLGQIDTVGEYKLKLHTKNGVYTCSIESDKTGTTLIFIFDQDSQGLSIGNPIGRFRCDKLGPLVQTWLIKDEAK